MNFVCVLALLALASIPVSFAQFGQKPAGPPKAAANVDDLPFIKCGVCESFVKQAMTAVKTLRAEEKPGKKLSEADIIDTLEKMCNPDSAAGEWITKIDLQEDGDSLKLVDMGEVGECEVECRTIARACEKVSEDMDLSDLSEALYKNVGRSALSQLACRDLTGVCSKKPPPLPEDRKPGPAFAAMDADKLSREKLMRSMKEAGLSGQMYDRDSIASMAAGLGKEGAGDDDDEDEDDPMAAFKGMMPEHGEL